MNPSTQPLKVWAQRIFGETALPDLRLKERLIQIVETLASRPLDAIPQACDSWASAKGAYRFLENRRVKTEDLQDSLFASTAQTCSGESIILSIQDTSTLSFGNRSKTEGLGPISDTGSHAQGLHLHPTLAVTSQGKLCGVLHQQLWARDPANRGKAQKRKDLPIEEKESNKWLLGMQGARNVLQAALPVGERPVLLHVFDREGDIHEVFAAILDAGDQAVIRSAYNRRIAMAEQGAHEAVRRSPLLGRTTVAVQAKGKQPAREAVAELRATSVCLKPNTTQHPQRQSLSLTLVEAWESEPPAGATPLHWLLWTTRDVLDVEAALEVVFIYKQRWVVEEYFLTLKSGCRVESLQLETAERLSKAIAIYAAIAVRLVCLRDQAREDSEQVCTSVLGEVEWKVLWSVIHKKSVPARMKAPSMREAILWIGRLGGHLGRKGDGMPGVRTLWRGWRDLSRLVEIYAALQPEE